MLDTELRRKLAWLIAIRAIVSTILLGSATLIELTAPGSFPIGRFFFLIGLTDALTGSALIDLTGGVTSYFSLRSLLPIVAGSTVQLRRGGLLVATLSTLLYVGVVSLQFSTADLLVHTGPVVALPSRLVAQYTV